MRTRARDVALVIIAAVFSVACISLGMWQLRRLAWRRALNVKIEQRLTQPAVSIDSLPRDSAGMHYRQVIVRGTYDYAHQVVLADRTRNGSPGVEIVTPVRMPGRDTALLVTRGWVYAPDGVSADLSRWRESDTVSAIGYARPLSVPFRGSPTLPEHPGAYRWLDLNALRASIPYPLYPVSVVLESDSANTRASSTAVAQHTPPRVPPPPLDEGPHLSYAIQWFSFAIIAIVGTIFFLRAGPPGRGLRLEPFEQE